MILYIKQKVFSLTDSYNVFDENLQPVYRVESEFLSFLSKIHLYDMYDNELFFIKKKLTFMFAEYEIYNGELLCAEVKQEFSFFRPRLTVTSSYGNFDIQGEFFDMDFDVICNGALLGRISKEWMTIGDSYKLEVANDKDAAFFTALTIAIDNCLHNGNKN